MNNKSMLQVKLYEDTRFFSDFFDGEDKPTVALQAVAKAKLENFPQYPGTCRANVNVKGKDYTFFYMQNDKLVWELTNVILPPIFESARL